MSRYRILLLDDEFSQNLVNMFVDLLPSLGAGVGLEGSTWNPWDPARFAAEFRSSDTDLIEVVLGLEDIAQNVPSDVDVAVLDVNLSAFGLGETQGLSILEDIRLKLAQEERSHCALLVAYTGDSKVLEQNQRRVVLTIDDYRRLAANVTPIIRVGDNVEGSLTSGIPPDSRRFPTLLREVVRTHLGRLSRERFSKHSDQAAFESLKGLSENFDRNEFNRVGRLRVDGWELRRLFPFHFAEISDEGDDTKAESLVASFCRLLQHSFRRRLGDLCDLFDAEVQVASGQAHPLRHVDTIPFEDGLAWRSIWSLLSAAWHRRFSDLAAAGDSADLQDTLTKLDEVIEGQDQNGFVEWVRRTRPKTIDFNCGGSFDVWTDSGAECACWCFWSEHYRRAFEVIATNALRHENKMLNFADFTSRDLGDRIRLSCCTGVGHDASFDAFERALNRSLKSGKLAELRYIVSNLYDGSIVVEATSDGQRWGLLATRDSVTRCEPQEEVGTRYHLDFPKGRW